eukprot:1030559-Rhodomonas_salina.1
MAQEFLTNPCCAEFLKQLGCLTDSLAADFKHCERAVQRGRTYEAWMDELGDEGSYDDYGDEGSYGVEGSYDNGEGSYDAP